MVAFTTTDLPASINTVEKLMVWGAAVLNNVAPNVTATEGSGVAERVAQFGPFEVTAEEPRKWRAIMRNSIPLNANWTRGVGKIWANAEDISSAAIPTEFKS